MAFFRVEPPMKERIYLIKNGVWQGYSLTTKYSGGYSIESNEGGYCKLNGVTSNNVNSSVVNYAFPINCKKLVIKNAHIDSAQTTPRGIGISPNTSVTNNFAQLSPSMVINSTTDESAELDLSSSASEKYLYMLGGGTATSAYHIKEMYFEI